MSNRPLSVLLAAAAVIGFGTAAYAQATSGAKPTPAAPKPIARADIVQELGANYKAVDTNGDGAVTSAEIAAAQARARQEAAALHTQRLDETFTKLDTNKDGQLSKAEFTAGSPAPQRPLTDPAKVISELDSNKDQKVSLTEFSSTPLANFDRVDINHDGIVTPDEAQKARGTGR